MTAVTCLSWKQRTSMFYHSFPTVFQGSENVLFVLCIRICIKRRNIGGTVKYNTEKLMEGFNLLGFGRGYNSGYHNKSAGSHFLKWGIGISCRKLFPNCTQPFTRMIIFLANHFATLYLFHTYLRFSATWNRRCFWLYVLYLTNTHAWPKNTNGL